jgi:hypothetical protein
MTGLADVLSQAHGFQSHVMYDYNSTTPAKTTVWAVPEPADLNQDGSVDLLDYAILASQWQQGPGNPPADIAPAAGDGIVDIKDLGFMTGQWLTN